jgi:hypothetical protein
MLFFTMTVRMTGITRLVQKVHQLWRVRVVALLKGEMMNRYNHTNGSLWQCDWRTND